MLGTVVLIGAVLFAQVGNPIVPPPAPAPNITVRNELVAPPPDPEAIAEASVQSSQAILTTIVAPPPVQWANELLGLPNLWTTTPPDLSYNHPEVRGLAQQLLLAALAFLAVIILSLGIGHALGQDAPFGRLVFAVVLAAGNLAFWEMGISINNAITTSIAGPDLPSMIRPHLGTTIDPGTAVGTVILTVVYTIVALLLLFSLLFRLGLLDVLIAVGSLALLLYATPQTEYLAQHYVRLSVAVLFGQVLIVLGLRVASVLGGLGTTGSVATLLSIVVLILVRTLPQILMSGGHQRQGNSWGMAAFLMLRRRLGL